MVSPDNRVVYSTAHGAMCPVCGKPTAQCNCRGAAPGFPADGVVRVGRQTKGRKGSGVTVIYGVPLGPEDLKLLAGALKAQCGCGGTVKDGVIEIQGDHRDRLVEALQKKGWTVKRAGG